MLTLKAPITTAAKDIHKYFFFVFLEKIKLDNSCESSSHETSSLFSSKDESKKIKVSSAAILLGTLRVKAKDKYYLSFDIYTRNPYLVERHAGSPGTDRSEFRLSVGEFLIIWDEISC